MIQGTVTEGREAIVALSVRGPVGEAIAVPATIDTGFTDYLSLPDELILRLGLPFVDRTRAFLADGTLVVIRLYRCHVAWGDREREITVHCLEGAPLVGMRLLWDHLLTMQVTAGGALTIGALG